MQSSSERKDIQKVMAYDLLRIFEKNPEKIYTAAELKELIDAYISGFKAAAKSGAGISSPAKIRQKLRNRS